MIANAIKIIIHLNEILNLIKTCFLIFIINNINMSSENKMKNPDKFIVDFPIESKIPAYCVQSITLPKCDISNKEIFWNDIEIKLFDIKIEETWASKYLFEWLKAVNYKKEKFTVFIKNLNFNGLCQEYWELKGCYFQHVSFGNYTYDLKQTDNICCMEITLSVEDCILL